MDSSRRPGQRSGRAPPPRLLASSDERLVELVLAGDDLAFEVLFDRHVADALWFAREVLDSWPEAEEAVRHSFAAARAYLAARDRDVEFRPWLHTILGNHCLTIVHARGPQPREAAKVVDLDAWRRRRGRLGIAAPLAPIAGLRESLMALCGIGTGAAATATTGGGASVLGGVLAKVAVTAVLAGGVGVAESSVSERYAASQPAPIEQRGGIGRPAPVAERGTVAMESGTVARSREQAHRRPGRARSAPRDRAALEGSRPNDVQPAPVAAPDGARSAPAPAPAPVAAGGPPAPAPSATHADEVAAIAEPVAATPRKDVEQALGGLQQTAGGAVARPPEPPPPPAPVANALTRIGDDLAVTTDSLTDDVRALVSPGSSAPAR